MKRALRTDFVELGRRFYEAPHESDPERSAQASYLFAYLGEGSAFHWPDLLQRRLVVVLGEPGSGKTVEMRSQVDCLRKSGSTAFFVQMDRLVKEPLTEVLGSESASAFQDWKEADRPGWFFFDSVDESKILRNRDLLTALDRILDGIGSRDLVRARLLFSSRISEWRPTTDADEIRRRFPAAGRTSPARGTSTPKAPEPLVVHIAPLDRDQVGAYAKWYGLDPVPFVRALDDQYAWEFARRPLDVKWLAEYWKHNGRLGTLTDLLEHSLRSSLRETSDREFQCSLTPEKARSGVERLAAAALLCRNLNFRVPDDSVLVANALDPAACLPETWSASERRALLNRAVFDAASYGCIRFHHRTVLEYLAASWLEKHVRDGYPLDDLEGLLFRKRSGRMVLRPALASVAAWLAKGDSPPNRLVRETLLQTEPEVFLSHGDARQLPVDYRRALLRALRTRYSSMARFSADTEPDALARLATPDLADDVSAMILDRSLPESLRADMLSLVSAGRLSSCYETALDITASPLESDEMKLYAAAALRDCDDSRILQRLADVARGVPRLTVSLSGALCEALYPVVLDADGLASLLEKTDAPKRYSSHLQWVLKRHLIENLTPALACSLLRSLERLLSVESSGAHASSRRSGPGPFGWLLQIVPAVVVKSLEPGVIDPKDVDVIVRAIRKLEEYWDEVDIRDESDEKSLSACVDRHPCVKRSYLWSRVERYRAARRGEPGWFGAILPGTRLVSFNARDVRWLARDASGMPSVADRALALGFAFDIWRAYGRRLDGWLALVGGCAGVAGFRWVFWRRTLGGLVSPLRYFVERRVKWTLLRRHWWQMQAWRCNRALGWIRDEFYLHRFLSRIYSGTATRWLYDLSQEAGAEGTSSRWASIDWSRLRRRRGPLVAWATERGCERSWLDHMPLLPHEEPEPGGVSLKTIVGLRGLQSLWQAGRLSISSLGGTDAGRAARYGVHELNGFPDWMPELVEAHPAAVRNVLCECIDAEWRFAAEREQVHEVLSKLTWQGKIYKALIADHLLARLHDRDPLHQFILLSAIDILLGGDSPPLAQLGVLAARRTPEYSIETPFFIPWVTIWIQLDGRAALEHLLSRVSELPFTQASRLVSELCRALQGQRMQPTPHLDDPDYLAPGVLRRLIPLVYRYIRPEDDVHHTEGGVYGVTDRDEAQSFRSGLLRHLVESDGIGVLGILGELQEAPELAQHRDWIVELSEKRLKQEADLQPWTAEDVRRFESEYEVSPRNDEDLFRVACRRLRDIKREIELSENSLRDEVQSSWEEAALRCWLKRKLADRSRERYTVPQEAEIDLEQRPDLRFEHPAIGSAVPVELKWADKHSAAELLERLKNQLVGQYMRAHNIHYGVYVIGHIDSGKGWRDPADGTRLQFEQLVALIQAKASQIEQARAGISGLCVIALDFTRPD